MTASAVVRADSLSPEGVRLTTFEVKFWRPVLAEFNTHRVFSRSSASSRAIPLKKQLEKVWQDPAGPSVWASEQKGMSGGAEIEDAFSAQDTWEGAAYAAAKHAGELGKMGVHKSIANRLLEPFLDHTVIVTATAWKNFFELRDSEFAQPEIREAAQAMREVWAESKPKPLVEHEWHLPFIDSQTWDAMRRIVNLGESMYPMAVKISAARCARVSYETHAGVRDLQEDLRLYHDLVTKQHWSPLEHVATPWKDNRQGQSLQFWGLDRNRHFVSTGHLPRVGNLLGWRQVRTEEEQARGIVTFR